jgi:hypothetical protein
MSTVGETLIVGRKIVEVRPMTMEELERQGWSRFLTTPVIVLDDGTVLFSSQDEEGNGPGDIFTMKGGILLSDGTLC